MEKFFKLPATDFASALGLVVFVWAAVALGKKIPGVKSVL